MISITTNWKEVVDKMKANAKAVTSASVSTLNKVAAGALTTGTQEVTARYNIKRSELRETASGRQRIKVWKANRSDLNAHLDFWGRPISLSYFDAKSIVGLTQITRSKAGKVTRKELQRRPKQQGVSVVILKGGGRRLLKARFGQGANKDGSDKKLFLATMKNGHTGIFENVGGKLFQRNVITIASMFASKSVAPKIADRITKDFNTVFEAQLKYYTARQGGVD